MFLPSGMTFYPVERVLGWREAADPRERELFRGEHPELWPVRNVELSVQVNRWRAERGQRRVSAEQGSMA